jgi:hypothetical protein
MTKTDIIQAQRIELLDKLHDARTNEQRARQAQEWWNLMLWAEECAFIARELWLLEKQAKYEEG